MKKMLMAMMVSVSVLAWGAAWTQGSQGCAFYGDCIEKEIAVCQAKMSRMDSDCPCIHSCACRCARQVKFLADHREELVTSLEEKGVRLHKHVVRYHLLKAFYTGVDREKDLAGGFSVSSVR